MNLLKKIVIKILQWFFGNPNIFLKTKDIILTNPSEHLYRSAKYIKSKNLNIPNDKFLILDIGAANGNTSRFFSKKFPECQVIGFEPIKSMAKIAEENCFSSKKIKIRNLALGKLKENRKFHVTQDKLSSSYFEINTNQLNNINQKHKDKFQIKEIVEVQCSTLDDEFQNENVLLMKIDTQGSELDILTGGKQLLNSTNFILIEMSTHYLYNGGSFYFQTDSFLRENGFALVDIYVTYRPNGKISEYDALYEKIKN